ncbi:hypothetical protein [Leucothrix arctica]|uniref:hypothetical protein n=1 Tax=Leucothrix arctica TaxID=1481894 RepID=UPI001304B443|nr:hypothetical protein [Leucothrix arctica]
MLTEYKDENSIEETTLDLQSVSVNDTIKQTTQAANEEQTEAEEELFFWFEPGVCG